MTDALAKQVLIFLSLNALEFNNNSIYCLTLSASILNSHFSFTSGTPYRGFLSPTLDAHCPPPAVPSVRLA